VRGIVLYFTVLCIISLVLLLLNTCPSLLFLFFSKNISFATFNTFLYLFPSLFLPLFYCLPFVFLLFSLLFPCLFLSLSLRFFLPLFYSRKNNLMLSATSNWGPRPFIVACVQKKMGEYCHNGFVRSDVCCCAVQYRSFAGLFFLTLPYFLPPSFSPSPLPPFLPLYSLTLPILSLSRYFFSLSPPIFTPFPSPPLANTFSPPYPSRNKQASTYR
jgi:hypothetical protein